jgi:hypothetical protein
MKHQHIFHFLLKIPFSSLQPSGNFRHQVRLNVFLQITFPSCLCGSFGSIESVQSHFKLLKVPLRRLSMKSHADSRSLQLGAVLKTRSSPYLTINIGNALDTFQVMYRTQDTNSNPSWAVTTVFIPVSHAKCDTDPSTCSHSIVTYEVPYDTVNPDATPSYLLQWREPYGDMYSMLGKGWFVSTPDYEGPTASKSALYFLMFCDIPQK